MYVERLLQISIATLTVLGPLLLGASDRMPALPIWVLLAAVTSLWVTDTVGWLRLGRKLTNVAALGALLLSLGEITRFEGGMDILSVAKLLVYLQVILLFQKKEFRTYWQLAVLSLLQVIVAAAFNHGASFGVLLAAYLFVGICTLSLFFLYRERELAGGSEGHGTPNEEREEETGKESGNRPLAPEGTSSSSPASASASVSPRWPLIGQEPEFVGSRRAAPVGLGREFWLRVVKMTLGSLVLTVLIFSAVPRLGSGAWYGTGLSLQRMVGFNDHVTLGALGTVIENPQEVFIAKFFDEATDAPYQVNGGVYFRGAILTSYARGSWDSRVRRGYRGEQAELQPISPPLSEGLVRQEITIQPMDREELFFVWPPVGIRQDDRVQVDGSRQRLLRPGQAQTRFSYELGTSAFEDHFQKSVMPAESRLNLRELLSMPPGGEKAFPGLVRQARQWLEESGLPEGDRLRRARWLEHMLRDSGQFQYSLRGQVRQAGIDPVEDFVENNRRGHCEYFATALALMLRSQGIPARVVVGFKTNEWNEPGQFYQVRQLHAHTWVEAYLEPQQIPPEVLYKDRSWLWADGAWLRLDPTPAARDLGLEGRGSVWNKLDSYLNWLDYAWNSYVVEMDRPRQEKAIYNPVVGTIRALWAKVSDTQWWAEVFGSAGVAFRDRLLWIVTGRWLNGALLASAIAALAVAVLALMLARRLWRRRPEADAAGRRAARGVEVEFYRQLEAVLSRFGLMRAATQTQREFAGRARSTLLEAPTTAHLAILPAEVVEAFYRVRFGGTNLDKHQTETVERALSQLAEAACAKEEP